MVLIDLTPCDLALLKDLNTAYRLATVAQEQRLGVPLGAAHRDLRALEQLIGRIERGGDDADARRDPTLRDQILRHRQ